MRLKLGMIPWIAVSILSPGLVGAVTAEETACLDCSLECVSTERCVSSEEGQAFSEGARDPRSRTLMATSEVPTAVSDESAEEGSLSSILAEDEQGSSVATKDTWLDTTRVGVQYSAHYAVSTVDGWFGDRSFDEHGTVSGSLKLGLLLREDDGADFTPRLRLRVRMPNLSQRAYVFIGRENKEEGVQGTPDTFSRSQLLLPEDRNQDQSFFVGLGYFFRENIDFRVGVRGGYRIFARARYWQDWWLTDQSFVDFSQTVFASVRDGVGTTSGLNYTYLFSDDLSFRWRNAATISTETDDGVAWSSAAGVIRHFPRERDLALDVVASGEANARVPVREYGVRMIYRRPFLREWLFAEGIVGYFWPRDDDDPMRRESLAAGVSVEMLF